MRRRVAALLIASVYGLGLGPARGQAPVTMEPAEGKVYTPPLRGAPEGRTGGASRDVGPVEQPSAPTDRDAALWQSIENSSNPADFEAFLMRYPNSDFASLAERRLAALKAHPPAPPGR